MSCVSSTLTSWVCTLQAVAVQHQLQYQAAAMQAQAMQAAAANAAWTQGNNPYLSGLCFPYNLYGAAAPQQLYAAYARSACCCHLSLNLFVRMLEVAHLCCFRPLACSDCAPLPSSLQVLAKS